MKLEKFSLKNKTALITGAAGLLGLEHAKALLSVGARVILTDINYSLLQKAQEYLSKSFDNKLIKIIAMDITSIENITNVNKNLKQEKWFLDILINNAAIDPKVADVNTITETSRLENLSLEQWNLEISVGLTGAFLCCKVFGNEMSLRKKGGVILNIASDLSVISPDQRLYKKNNIKHSRQPVKPVTYSVIKHGIIGLTKYIATYWLKENIRVNALSPGGVLNSQDKEFVKKVSKLIPMNRLADKQEYHSVVQFLCSDASSYMNGQNVIMDGGRSIW